MNPPYNKGPRDRGGQSRIDNGITTRFFGNNHKNMFVAKFKDENQDPQKVSLGSSPDGFPDERAEEFVANEIPLIDNAPNFQDDYTNHLAQEFLKKYSRSNIIGDDRITAEGTLDFIQGSPKDNLAGRFPGSDGVSVS